MRMIFIYGIMLILIPIAVMGVLGFLLMATHLEDRGLQVTEATIRAQSDIREMEADDHLIAQTNRMVHMAQKMDHSQSAPSAIIRTLSAITPDALRVEKIAIAYKQIEIHGIAEERNVVLQFKHAMEASPCFNHVTLPLTSLVDRHDTDFTITAIVTPCQ